jgi:hypothetical protein
VKLKLDVISDSGLVATVYLALLSSMSPFGVPSSVQVVDANKSAEHVVV